MGLSGILEFLFHRPLQVRAMEGTKQTEDADGNYTNTDDKDCEWCKCDLFLSSVVSPLLPGKAVCPEHVAALGVPVETCTLLLRYACKQAGSVSQVVTHNPSCMCHNLRCLCLHACERSGQGHRTYLRDMSQSLDQRFTTARPSEQQRCVTGA